MGLDPHGGTNQWVSFRQNPNATPVDAVPLTGRGIRFWDGPANWGKGSLSIPGTGLFFMPSVGYTFILSEYVFAGAVHGDPENHATQRTLSQLSTNIGSRPVHVAIGYTRGLGVLWGSLSGGPLVFLASMELPESGSQIPAEDYFWTYMSANVIEDHEVLPGLTEGPFTSWRNMFLSGGPYTRLANTIPGIDYPTTRVQERAIHSFDGAFECRQALDANRQRDVRGTDPRCQALTSIVRGRIDSHGTNGYSSFVDGSIESLSRFFRLRMLQVDAEDSEADRIATVLLAGFITSLIDRDSGNASIQEHLVPLADASTIDGETTYGEIFSRIRYVEPNLVSRVRSEREEAWSRLGEQLEDNQELVDLILGLDD
jgi:hypothetical protein